MKCGVWRSKMALILSEYLISIRVVDYCSLGLLSENKIKRKRVPVGKYILISTRECKKSQLTNAEHWQELKQMLTVASRWNWMSLTQMSSTARQQKRPSHLTQQHAETLFMTDVYRALKLWRPAEALFHTGHTKCFARLPVQARPEKKARNHLFSLSVFACISI